jgi:ATP-dependent Zn protease
MSSSPAKKHYELQATAYHEAGHAVVALRLGLKFRHVTIKPDSDSLGHLKCDRHPKWFNPNIDKSDRTRMLTERHIIVDFVGQIAEAKLLGRRPRFGMACDNYHAVDLALYSCGCPAAAEKCHTHRVVAIRDARPRWLRGRS